MEFVHLAVILGLMEYIVFVGLVGAGRGKFNVTAPATTGNPDWERLYRIQQNTMEQLVLFIPGIYGFAYLVDPLWAVGIGSIYLIGRIVYFFGYREAAEKRGVGAAMSVVPNIVLVLGALVGWVVNLF